MSIWEHLMERGKKVDASRVLLHQVFSLQLYCLIEHTHRNMWKTQKKKSLRGSSTCQISCKHWTSAEVFCSVKNNTGSSNTRLQSSQVTGRVLTLNQMLFHLPVYNKNNLDKNRETPQGVFSSLEHGFCKHTHL